jgi:hypothetical protein
MISIEIDMCEVFFNDVLEKLFKNIVVWNQKLAKLLEMKKRMKKNLQKLHAQQIKWRFMEKMHFLGFFYVLTIIKS